MFFCCLLPLFQKRNSRPQKRLAKPAGASSWRVTGPGLHSTNWFCVLYEYSCCVMQEAPRKLWRHRSPWGIDRVLLSPGTSRAGLNYLSVQRVCIQFKEVRQVKGDNIQVYNWLEEFKSACLLIWKLLSHLIESYCIQNNKIVVFCSIWSFLFYFGGVILLHNMRKVAI